MGVYEVGPGASPIYNGRVFDERRRGDWKSTATDIFIPCDRHKRVRKLAFLGKNGPGLPDATDRKLLTMLVVAETVTAPGRTSKRVQGQSPTDWGFHASHGFGSCSAKIFLPHCSYSVACTLRPKLRTGNGCQAEPICCAVQQAIGKPL